jgi:hypothetical protein
MAKIATYQLDTYNMELLSRYVEDHVLPLKTKNDIIQISKIINLESEISASEWHILNLANYYLSETGLSGYIHTSMIEIWRYRLFGDKQTSALPKHRDSYGVFFGPINTVIFYLRKDKTIKGGNLEIYKSMTSFKPKGIYECDAGTVLVFDGSVVHKVETLVGTGIRDCIVVQMRCPYTWSLT